MMDTKVKYEAVKGKILKVGFDEIVVEPPRRINLGADKTFVCRLSRLRHGREPYPGDKVMAFNVHKTLKGWRARRAILLDD